MKKIVLRVCQECQFVFYDLKWRAKGFVDIVQPEGDGVKVRIRLMEKPETTSRKKKK